MLSSFFISVLLLFLFVTLAEAYAIVKTAAEKTPTKTFETPAMYRPEEVLVVKAIPATPADISRPHTNKSFLTLFVLSYIFPKIGADTTADIKPKPAIRPADGGLIL